MKRDSTCPPSSAASAASSPSVPSTASNATLASSASISAMAPKAPMRESFMMSSARSRSLAAAQAVRHVGQAVFMKAAGQQHGGDGAATAAASGINALSGSAMKSRA